MKFLRQVFSITEMNLKNIMQRSGSSIVIVVGIAGSVAVMVSLLAMAEGLNSTISSTGKDDRVIILREGASSELGRDLQCLKWTLWLILLVLSL